MKWSILAPGDTRWLSDMAAVLGDLLDHEVVEATTPRVLSSVDGVVLCGDETWRKKIVAEAVAAGTLARAAVEYARDGGLLLAIGSGFGAACNLGLLPGDVLENQPGGFLSRMVGLRVEGIANPWAQRAMVGDVWEMPVRSEASRFVAPGADLDQLERDGLILLRYVDNPNGSARDIAAIMNRRRNVLGIAPHPENVVDASLVEPQWPGLESGRVFFESVADWVDEGAHRGPAESQR